MQPTTNPGSGQNVLMPHTFGAGPRLRTARFPREFIVTLVYLTDEAALTAVLPEGFALAGPPMLHFRYRFSDQLDWALNSSHRAVGVSVSCTIDKAGQTYHGVHWLALWENDYMAVILGREMFGVAKLGADIAYQSDTAGEHRAVLSEAGRPLMELRCRTGSPLQGTDLQELRRRGAANMVLGYKRIPNARGDGTIVSHPTAYRHTVTIERAWSAEGDVIVHEADPSVHIWSAHIINGIRELPLLEKVAAVVTEGSAELDLTSGHEL